MSAPSYWLSRLTPRQGLGYRDLVALGSLDPYGQHQTLWKLFDLPPKEERAGQPAPFLFRAEQHDGLPVLYVLSTQVPLDPQGVWRIESKRYAPEIRIGERLLFKLRANPTVARGEKGRRGQRHDVVMDAKRRMGWKDLPQHQRPTLADLSYEAGACWLRNRQQRLAVRVDEDRLRVDGYSTWRQHGGTGIALTTLDFEGVLEVVDPGSFLSSLLGGIGPAKAFGCGLMLIRRV